MSDGDGSNENTHLVLKEPAPLAHVGGASTELEFQGLWFSLARKPWRSLVVVPGDEHGSAAYVATALAAVGRQLRSSPVTFLVMAGPLDYASAGKIVGSMTRPATEGEEPSTAEGRVIVAIPSVLTEPLGIAVTEAADAVVLCIAKGKSRIPSVELTLDRIGRERVVGCVMV